MASALLLSALLTLPAQSAPAPAFHPHFAVRFQPAARRQVVARPADDREVICGLVVIHKTPAADPKILVPARETGAAVRRIEPQGCGAKTTVTPK
jgi:hypothetical protein